MKKLELLRNCFKYLAEAIDDGNTTFTDEECDEILDIINKTANVRNKLSKYQACKYLNVSRATFDNWVKAGKLPEGKKEIGFKEKFWELSDLKRIKHEN